ncbi:MAG: outer membrane protein assembly factor BamA [Syntrophobacterales bacterium]|nr:outer membrane protein assembly factor BamA [Syntrophobacterales bacterium]
MPGKTIVFTWTVFLSLIFFVGPIGAQEVIVGISPPVIHGTKNVEATSKAISSSLEEQLRKQGIKVALEREVFNSDDQAKRSGSVKGWDYALWGSVTVFGDALSIDLRLVPIKKTGDILPVFAEAKGMKDIIRAAGEIAEKVASRVFPQWIVSSVRIEGNERIGADAIKAVITTSQGQPFSQAKVQEDIKNIYNMGYFEDVRVSAKDTPEGKEVIFIVRENPIVDVVEVKGNSGIDKKDILAAIQTKPYSVLKRKQLADDVQNILTLYHQKAYYDAKVDYTIEFPRDPRKAQVTFRIQEGKKFFVRKITFVGNKSFSDRKLKSVMNTKEKSILFFWSTERGVLQHDVLETDADRLTAFYHDNGFMDARVGTPKVEQKSDGFYIQVPIEEGARYKVGYFRITGDPLETKENISKKIQTKVGEYFSREKLRKDIQYLTRLCLDQGYARAEVDPHIQKDSNKREASIELEVKKGAKVSIGRITISGNMKTKDKVIRRQFQIAEGDTFSATKIENSESRLKRLDYFEEIKINPVDTESPNLMDIEVQVKEKLTGHIGAGGGYSSDEGFFVGGEVTQRNLFGRGQILTLKAHFGGSVQRYMLSFIEPSVFDTYYFFASDIYDWVREYDDFTKEAQGFQLRTGRAFGNWSKFTVGYIFENTNITDVSENASSIIKRQEGRHIKSSVVLGFERDSTDHPFLPTKGSIVRATIEESTSYLGSETDFTKYEIAAGKYFPLFWKFVGLIKGELGWIIKTGDKDILLSDRFFLGGINSVRSYDWGDLSPKDPATGDKIGGTKYGLFNTEITFPIVEEINLKGVLFFDAGNAFAEGENLDVSKFKMGVGGGLRWASPLGPLRIEWAYNPDPGPDDPKSRWQFSMGAFF